LHNGEVTYFCRGRMAEWSIAAVLKTVDCNRSGGSNPSSSASQMSTFEQNPENQRIFRIFCFSGAQ
jgi:hypothetical protein